ncbi:helix-turn-helix domain-containing protein [Thauera linaloolentis]|uniref:PdtC, QsbA n=1 Tax=Thauera linaloolentis (strain DSM 12138 / JCM 21573 / CCUG 41526 / CIP 105981 / IAM 15112 / NBRC 102519 / 47Lol) TaxID=1123367 RepID=N6Y7I8_THAL4|nr:AraC family transcriptional regulator [Thauera linaloolentis]ENO90251.1 PdtC, QsbA [Thauera linaloolentis 47Lol = DSM 12138]MCM8566258.1 AraC family transcriptional regulator [Thauera linaloolentis]
MSARNNCCRLTLDEPRIRSALGSGKTRLQLPEDIGHCYQDFVELEPGLGLGRLHYIPSVPLIEETNGPHDGHVMVITLGMKGRSCYEGQDATSLEFQKGYTTISSFRAIPGERRYEAGDTVSQLRVVAHESLICKYVGQERTAEILGSRQLSRLAFRASTPAAMTHAKALLSHLLPCQTRLSRLDLHIHTLSLLNEQFSLLAPQHCAPSSPFSPSEIERIEKARQIMDEHLDKPLTLDYLATIVGTNKNKLKDGMIYLYNATPTELLLELRMNKAIALLESGQQVSQVAWQVGYKYANNFTVAFTRYHGKSPKAMFGKRALEG